MRVCVLATMVEAMVHCAAEKGFSLSGREWALSVADTLLLLKKQRFEHGRVTTWDRNMATTIRLVNLTLRTPLLKRD